MVDNLTLISGICFALLFKDSLRLFVDFNLLAMLASLSFALFLSIQFSAVMGSLPLIRSLPQVVTAYSGILYSFALIATLYFSLLKTRALCTSSSLTKILKNSTIPLCLIIFSTRCYGLYLANSDKQPIYSSIYIHSSTLIFTVIVRSISDIYAFTVMYKLCQDYLTPETKSTLSLLLINLTFELFLSGLVLIYFIHIIINPQSIGILVDYVMITWSICTNLDQKSSFRVMLNSNPSCPSSKV
jgi:hypothetical protein